MNEDFKWARLWEVATGEPQIASITPTDDPNTVMLRWPDGQPFGWHWQPETKRWVAAEEIRYKLPVSVIES